MTQTTSTAAADLSYLRDLAKAGQEAPLMAGPYLVAGGGWFAAASLSQWPVVRNLLGLGPTQATLLWLVAGVAFAVHLAYLIAQDRGRVETVRNQAVNSVWTGVGFAIFAFWVGVTILAVRQRDFALINTILLQVLSLYGAAWVLAARMTGRGWMRVNAFFAFLTVPVLGLLMGTGQEYLAYAIALLLTAVVPGLRLNREARALDLSRSRA